MGSLFEFSQFLNFINLVSLGLLNTANPVCQLPLPTATAFCKLPTTIATFYQYTKLSCKNQSGEFQSGSQMLQLLNLVITIDRPHIMINLLERRLLRIA